jgi:hypothetical protein
MTWSIHGRFTSKPDLYLQLATQGQISADDLAKLRELAVTLQRRDRAEAIVLAGTDLNLVFNESNGGFPPLIVPRPMWTRLWPTCRSWSETSVRQCCSRCPHLQGHP